VKMLSMESLTRDNAQANTMCNPCITLKAFAREFKTHNDRLRMFAAAKTNSKWPYVFGTSPWFPETSSTLAICRTVLAAIQVVHLVWNFSMHFEGGFWFIYLTHLTQTIVTAYSVFACLTAWRALPKLREKGPSKSEETRLPWFVSTSWALFHVAMPAALLVVVLYWTLDNPVWNLKFVPVYMGFYVHGIIFVLLLVDLFLGRNVFYLKHVVFFFAYVLSYLIWSIVHGALDIGKYDGCDAYPDKEDCPIYGVLDWNKPKAAGILSVIIIFFVVPLCQYPLWWCVFKRRLADFVAHHEDESKDEARGPSASAADKDAELDVVAEEA